jgi:hypothetical protein
MTVARRIIDGALVALAAVTTLSWIVLVAAHAGDWYHVDHVAGVRMALASSAADGQLYPPLHADGVFGGSRYMPLSIVLHAGLSQVTGDLVLSGKVLGAASMASLVALVWWLLRRFGCPRALAAALGAAVLVGEPGLGATFGMRADALPAALQLGAVGIALFPVRRSRSAACFAEPGSAKFLGRRSRSAACFAGPGPAKFLPGTAGIIVAAVLAGLAFTSKITAVWAAIAIFAWLVQTDRARAWLFAATCSGVVAVLVIVFAVASGGRLGDLMTLTFAGIGGVGDAVTAPYRLLRTVFGEAIVTWALLPAALIGFGLGRLHTRGAALSISFAVAIVVLLIVFTDIGVGVNQLVDLTALVAIGTGLLATRLPATAAAADGVSARGGRWDAAPTVVGVVVLWVVGSAAAYTMGTEVPAAISGSRPAQPLTDVITEDMTVLSEDPGVLVALGRRPTVLDPFILLRLERRDPAAVAALADRIRSAEFDLVVLLQPLEDDSGWWRRYHFGETVIDAVREAYVPAGRSDGYYLYEPARRPTRMTRAGSSGRPPPSAAG